VTFILFQEGIVKICFLIDLFALFDDLIDDVGLCHYVSNLRSFFFFNQLLFYLVNLLKVLLRNMGHCC
jgi:hypothetical protein